MIFKITCLTFLGLFVLTCPISASNKFMSENEGEFNNNFFQKIKFEKLQENGIEAEEEKENRCPRWFILIAVLFAFFLSYKDIIGAISARLSMPVIKSQNKIMDYNLTEDIQQSIEEAKSVKELKKVCEKHVSLALSQAQDLTKVLNEQNDLYDQTWRIQNQALWRRDMLDYLESEIVSSIEVAWKVDEFCRLAEYTNYNQKISAIAEFQKIAIDKGLQASHLRKLQGQLGDELEAAVKQFNAINQKRLMQLARYTFDVTYGRSLWQWVERGPIGNYIKAKLNNFVNIVQSFTVLHKTKTKQNQK